MTKHNLQIQYFIPGKFRDNFIDEIDSLSLINVLNRKINKFAKISYKIYESINPIEPIEKLKLYVSLQHSGLLNMFLHVEFKRDVSNAERKKFLKYLKHYPNYELAKYLHIFRFRKSSYIGWKRFNVKKIKNMWFVERKTNDKLRKIKKEI